MILVVSDTSAISALVQIGETSILRHLYDRILIPRAVQQELLRSHKSIPDFIHVHAIVHSVELEHRRSMLDEGEACAITLAEQIHADLLLIDEKKGRAIAEQAGLRFIGLVGVLIEAKRRGVISAICPILDRLVTEAGFRLAPVLRAAVLREANE